MLVPRFALSGRGTLSGAGGITLTLNGPPAWWRYEISTVVVTCPPNAGNRPTAAVYRGAITQATLLGQSRAADAVTFQGAPGDVLLPGDMLIVVIAGALPGGMAVVNCYGEQVPT